MFEQGPQPKIEQKEVLAILKEKGKEDPYAVEFLKKWIGQEQERIESIADPVACGIENIKHTIEYATLLSEAGFIEESWECLNDSLDLAKGFGQEELFQEMKHLMEELEKRS